MKLLELLLLCPALAFGQTTVLGTGLVVKGTIGPFAIQRPDAQLEIQNGTFGKRALLSIYNEDPNDESAVTFGTRFDNGATSQIAASFAALVNGNNGSGWMGIYGIHIVGYSANSQTFTAWSNNSVRLAGGPVTLNSENHQPPANSVEIGYGGAVNGGSVLIFSNVAAHPAPLGTSQMYQYNGAMWIMPPSGTPKQIAP